MKNILILFAFLPLFSFGQILSIPQESVDDNAKFVQFDNTEFVMNKDLSVLGNPSESPKDYKPTEIIRQEYSGVYLVLVVSGTNKKTNRECTFKLVYKANKLFRIIQGQYIQEQFIDRQFNFNQ